MIKQIQLRGISHRPSDRMTADGGLEECIDLRLEEQEQTVAKAPVDVTDEVAPGLSESGLDVMYIHKGNGYTNYVGLYGLGNSLYAYIYDPEEQEWVLSLISTRPYNIKSIVAVGNTLVICQQDGIMHYALFTEGAYKYLGIEIPKPRVWFYTEEQELDTISLGLSLNEFGDVYSVLSSDENASAVWSYVFDNKENNADAGAFYKFICDTVWEHIEKQRKKDRSNKVFCSPVAVRYAVKLFDGSYCKVSEPILLLSSSSHQFVNNIIGRIGKPSGQSGSKRWLFCGVNLGQRFTAEATFAGYDFADWGDIVESVDIFISTDILVPGEHARLVSAGATSEDPFQPGSSIVFVGDSISINFDGNEYAFTEEGVGVTDDNVPRAAFEREFLKKGNFYLLESLKLDSYSCALSPVSQDDLVVRKRLELSEAHTVYPDGELSNYNGRLVSTRQMIHLSTGHVAPHAKSNGEGTDKSYQIVYHVPDDNGVVHLVGGYSGTYDDEAVRALVLYPDAKCRMAELYVNSGSGFNTKVLLPMKEHPLLDCSYGFWGLDKKLDTPDDDERTTEQVTGLPELPPQFYTIENRLMLSEMDNPFVFPLGQRQRFSDRIIGALPATIALSTGQFGQFPLYVFTEGGIWAISLDDEGKMAASHPVSRDVALEGTIAQLDQAIVFVTKQGLMILQGSQISCLSPFMNGPQYTIKDIAPAGSALRTALTADGYGSLLTLSLDTTMFQDFAEGSKPLYDYENKRILLFNPNKGYAYEFDLESQTWRKHSLPDTFTRVLNGYPSAYSYMNGKIYEWSVRPDFNAVNPTARKGWLLTRPFDLGEPDIRKAITAIRVRGAFNHSDVKCILLGSMNGHDWQRLTSMRGGSYKSFRLLLLTNLTPGERISWVDVEYDVRFANKLR